MAPEFLLEILEYKIDQEIKNIISGYFKPKGRITKQCSPSTGIYRRVSRACSQPQRAGDIKCNLISMEQGSPPLPKQCWCDSEIKQEQKRVVLFCYFILETGSHCATLAGLGLNIYRPGWPQTPRGMPASASFVLGLKICTTTGWFVCFCLVLFLRQGLCSPGWLLNFLCG